MAKPFNFLSQMPTKLQDQILIGMFMLHLLWWWASG
jgi:hypothetical protein